MKKAPERDKRLKDGKSIVQKKKKKRVSSAASYLYFWRPTLWGKKGHC